MAEKERVVITRHGKRAGVLIGFESEGGWFDYKLVNNPRFLRRAESARRSLRAGKRGPFGRHVSVACPQDLRKHRDSTNAVV